MRLQVSYSMDARAEHSGECHLHAGLGKFFSIGGACSGTSSSCCLDNTLGLPLAPLSTVFCGILPENFRIRRGVQVWVKTDDFGNASIVLVPV